MRRLLAGAIASTLTCALFALRAEPVVVARFLPTAPVPGTGIRGITLAPIEDLRIGPMGYGTAACEEALDEIAALGATWISLTPFGRVDDLQDTFILHDFEIPVAQNERRLLSTARAARARGLRVALIPHLYVMNGEWRGEIEPASRADLDAWFAAYERFILRFARVAERMGADLFSIGVEFKSTSNAYSDRWRAVIAAVREEYGGPLTYSANWDELEQVEFWDALDLIGVNAFWPLARAPGDGYPVMIESAEQITRQLEALSILWDRPVVLTEFGVKSATDSALAPWEWPEHCEALRYDEQYQAQAYEAVLARMTRHPWFAGLFVWKYFSDPFDETQEPAVGFSPRGKLAERRLEHWMRSEWPPSCANGCFF